nr:hypothetical protein [Azohydromonas sediminis]
MQTTDVPTGTKQRLQARVIGSICAEMVAQIGERQAVAVLDALIRKAAIAEGRVFVEREPGRGDVDGDGHQARRPLDGRRCARAEGPAPRRRALRLRRRALSRAGTSREGAPAGSGVCGLATTTALSSRAATRTSTLSASRRSWRAYRAAPSATVSSRLRGETHDVAAAG